MGVTAALHARPDAEYVYSNVGYSVLAAIVEKVSGIGYEEFLAKHLFTGWDFYELGPG